MINRFLDFKKNRKIPAKTNSQNGLHFQLKPRSKQSIPRISLNDINRINKANVSMNVTNIRKFFNTERKYKCKKHFVLESWHRGQIILIIRRKSFNRI